MISVRMEMAMKDVIGKVFDGEVFLNIFNFEIMCIILEKRRNHRYGSV